MFDAHFGRDSNLQFVFASHAAEVPDKCWCSFEGIEHSYAEIDADANRVAHALIDVGVARGDRVAVYMDNCVEYFVIMFAIHRVGAVYVPCSTHYSADELEYQLSHSGAAVVFVDGAHRATLDQARQTCAAVTTVIVVGADTGGADVDLATLLEQGSPEMPSVAAQVTASELAMIMYTSGTT
ncbi:MAG: acyl-CoA synthetase, partial [Ilumatobacteraceae bacterium]|nr:acyl-CoA synthetase [Ilumatobacteraceae bacterium]